MSIIKLPPQLANMISAGEVVERPLSVVKELVENSIDAGSTDIRISLLESGIRKITVTDNGCGIEASEMPMAFETHATIADICFCTAHVRFRG
jgi:DNA mismatch repair protein MutL